MRLLSVLVLVPNLLFAAIDPPTNFAFGSGGSGGGAAGLGWTLNEQNTGLAAVGLDCDSLPEYAGANPVPNGSNISEVRFTSDEVLLYLGDITIERSCFKPSSPSGRSSNVFAYNPDTGTGQQGPVTISDSDFIQDHLPGGLVYANCAFRGAGSLYRNKMYGMGSGICYFGSANSSATEVIEGNYVYGLRGGFFGSPPQQSHNASATTRSFPGTQLIWRNNKLISQSGSDSGALFIQPYAGGINSHRIEGNYFETNGWDIYTENHSGNTYSGFQLVNNRFSGLGYGAVAVASGAGFDVWEENYLYDAADPNGQGAVLSCPAGTCGADQ